MFSINCFFPFVSRMKVKVQCIFQLLAVANPSSAHLHHLLQAKAKVLQSTFQSQLEAEAVDRRAIIMKEVQVYRIHKFKWFRIHQEDQKAVTAIAQKKWSNNPHNQLSYQSSTQPVDQRAVIIVQKRSYNQANQSFNKWSHIHQEVQRAIIIVPKRLSHHKQYHSQCILHTHQLVAANISANHDTLHRAEEFHLHQLSAIHRAVHHSHRTANGITKELPQLQLLLQSSQPVDQVHVTQAVK